MIKFDAAEPDMFDQQQFCCDMQVLAVVALGL